MLPLYLQHTRSSNGRGARVNDVHAAGDADVCLARDDDDIAGILLLRILIAVNEFQTHWVAAVAADLYLLS